MPSSDGAQRPLSHGTVCGSHAVAHTDCPPRTTQVSPALHAGGVEIVPVPVYYPDVTEILGARVYRRVADVPGPIDIVDVFRRSADVAAHCDDILHKRPRAVWLQSGIRDDQSAERWAAAGILVVQERCLMVDWQHYAGNRPPR